MSSSESHEVTDLLALVGAGDPSAADRLLSVVYAELRSLAASHMRRERPDHTLQATALVHEAWMRLVNERTVTWKNRSHFFGIATQAMRRVLLDHARSRGRRKRTAGERVELGDVADPIDHDALDVIAVDEALQRLEALDPRAAKVVELRFFGGLSVEETAEVLEIGTATVKRDWSFARAFLQRALDGDEPDG
jgi:RNA polymerase sigma-70 factor, ECF subfamily